ncbi:probable ATP-dependent RNA helicase DDX49 [Aethina tumida]|uniref:probable ATP-dependent RNA helicase DDX49 n=1 Tax=Aethina tumida TaxID=116153 RepID=UPI00096B4C3D|nr:probable ATP-dependent RNA helicase DDX49 [Aethina tumida]
MEDNRKQKAFSGLNPWIVRQCATIGVKDPTPIQVNCIPEILKGRDCIGAAKTGSGKTLAFALPIIQKLCEDPYGIYALILTPTRELAYQIADQFAVIGKPMNLKHCVVVGGVDMVAQGQELSKKPHIVVATPGRLADHLESCSTFTLSKIKFLVLDEADRLLGGHFDDQIKTIFTALPKTRQNLFFSATITDTLQKLKTVTGRDCFLYEAPAEVATVEQLEQHYVLCPKDVKDAYLVEVIRTYRATNQTGNIMIFTDTCRNCQVLSMTLNEVGFENVALHAMIPQSQRLGALNRFKSNTVKMLIATDVASRGLDIPTVQLVVNHMVPKVPKEYIHRVGRTARAGRGGKAITLVTPYDIPLLQAIEEHIKMKLTEFKLDDSEVGKIFTQISVTKSEAYIQLDEKDFYEKKMINKRKKWILEGLDPDEEEEKLLNKRKKLKKSKKKKKQKVEEYTDNKTEDNNVNVDTNEENK